MKTIKGEKMKINKKFLIIKNARGQNSLKRVIAFFGFIALTVGFILMAKQGKLDANTFWTYPLGLTILYFPALAIKLFEIWKGVK